MSANIKELHDKFIEDIKALTGYDADCCLYFHSISNPGLDDEKAKKLAEELGNQCGRQPYPCENDDTFWYKVREYGSLDITIFYDKEEESE